MSQITFSGFGTQDSGREPHFRDSRLGIRDANQAHPFGKCTSGGMYPNVRELALYMLEAFLTFADLAKSSCRTCSSQHFQASPGNLFCSYTDHAFAAAPVMSDSCPRNVRQFSAIRFGFVVCLHVGLALSRQFFPWRHCLAAAPAVLFAHLPHSLRTAPDKSGNLL